MADAKSTPGSGAAGAQPQPGTVIAPGAASTPPPVEPVEVPAEPVAPVPVADVPEAPAPPVSEIPVPSTLTPETPEPAEQPLPDDPSSEPDSPPIDNDDQSVTWTASEFVVHDKSAGWYAMLAVGVLLLAALIFIIIRDLVSVTVVIIAGLLLGVYGSHKPRQLEYRIDKRGVGIGKRHYVYDEFKSFSVVPEGAFASIVFMPLKRFAVPTTIYYAPADEDRILAVLSDQLPFEEHRSDAVDSLMRHIRF